MASSDSEDHTPTKKRARTNGSTEEGSGNGRKQRGRPRVDTQDETAADRRRTQIRLAQRAYRQRKETTITALKSRVTELESAIDDMNKAFLQFNDSAMNSGILNMRPELARELKKTTETFVRLAKEAATDGATDGEEQDYETVSERALVSRDANPQSAKTDLALKDETLDIGWGYAQMFENQTSARTSQEVQIASYLSSLPTHDNLAGNQNQMLPFGLISDPSEISRTGSPFQQFNVRVPSPPPLGIDLFAAQLPKLATIRSPYTYSFQESTFARRLQRAAIERGFHLLSTSTHRPSVYKHVFKLALLSQTREQLIDRFRILLTKTNLETLDFWQTPYIHLGGAGTHYPRRDSNGNIIATPNGWTVQGMGPFPPRVRLYSDTGVTREIEIDLRGFEGEWFDPHDVQGYLEERSCKISPHSSFAEAWIDIPPTSDAESIASPLAMDLGMGLPPVDTSAFFPPLPMTGGATPVNESASSSRSCSGSESAMTGMSTPPTPNLNDFNVDMSKMPDLSTQDFFLGFEMPNSSNAFDPFSTSTDPAKVSFPTLDNKSAASQMPGPNLYDNFSFDTGGTFDGSGTDLDNTFDILSPKTDLAKQPNKRLVTVDVNKLIDELINRCVCLGRSPGFRRADVDKAFNNSLIHALRVTEATL